MKNHNLVERYIYAVTKRMPEKIKEDVAKELQALIDDMLAEEYGEEFCERKVERSIEAEQNMEPEWDTEKVKAVLKKLGTPSELYEKYMGGKKQCLIGEPYYSTYLLVLKVVLLCTVFGMTVSGIVQIITAHDTVIWYEAILDWAGDVFGGLAAGFAYVTLIFAFFYHRNVQLYTSFDPDTLPQVPKKNELLNRKDSIASIIFQIVFLCLFLYAPQIFCVIITGSGERYPIFDTEAILNRWYLVMMLAGFGLIKEAIKLFEGRYTKRLMFIVIGMDCCSAVVATIWLMGQSILSQACIDFLTSVFTEEDAWIAAYMQNIQQYFLAVMLFALLLDALTVAFHTNKAVLK